MSLMQSSFESLPFQPAMETRSISAENPRGERSGGAKHQPEKGNPASRLGTGWKARPCITLPAGAVTQLADVEGPGMIVHMWMTVDPKAYRSCLLKIYWDQETTPSVEVPLGDFFANGHGERCPINSIPVSVNSTGGFNSYWQMPFRTHCRVEIENQYWEPIDYFYYQITYQRRELPKEVRTLHGQWRRSVTSRDLPEHTLLDGVEGAGLYAGTYLAWTQLSEGWWGEGEVKFYIDEGKENPTICGTGTEDYFGGAWGFSDGTYSTPFLGYPQQIRRETSKHGLYRWHVLDPIHFSRSLAVTVQALGWWPDGTFQPLSDDIASVALWYQEEPHAPFPEMADLHGRLPR